MTIPRTVRRIVLAATLPLLAASFPADGQKARRGGTAAPRPVAADTRIIPLPLNPIVPAGQRLCAARTPSGLGYTMLRPSAGAKPGAGDLTLVNYIGYLAATGVVFDQGMRSALSVGGVIPGFAEGLQLLAKGGVVRLCIPAALGYGAQGTGPIPANADLVFQVELIDYRPAAASGGVEAAPAEPGGATPQ